MSESEESKVGDDRDYDRLAREVGGRTTRKVLHKLRKQDYIGNLRQELGLAHQTVEYHIEKLMERGLVAETGKAEGRRYYKITAEGKEVLERLNISES